MLIDKGLTPGNPEIAAVRLCLNMIVRNESAILQRCLLSVLPHLSCYVVCDTGSTDNTVQIVGDVLAEIPGEVHQIAFHNFEQARNEALDIARRSALEFDYILFIDADMELVVSDSSFRETLIHSAYLMRQVAGSMAYYNVRLVAREAKARYVGATHEYLDLETTAERLEETYMLDHACGSSRTEKTERDLALLTTAVEADPEDRRSHFYLAQTLREAGRHQEAIVAYQRRVDLGGWDEEVWYSRFMIARCFQASGQPPEFVANCLEAYQVRPSRAEPLHALAQHYRNQGRHEVALMFCEAGLQIPLPDDLLFVDEEVYRTGLRHELSISGYYCTSLQRQSLGRRYADELSVDRSVSPWLRENVRTNWKYYAKSATELFPSARFVPLEHPLPDGFSPCNPSLALRDGEIWCVLRSVNYFVVDGTYYVRDGTVIRTQNYLLKFNQKLETISSVPIVEDPPRPEHPTVDGLEDIRLTWHGDRLRGSANFADANYRRRMAVFDLHEDGRVENLTGQDYEADHNQKNWMPFVEDGQLRFIYWTDPTVVLRWDEQSRQCTPWLTRECPLALENQRGGSGVIAFNDGWLYVTHEVSFSGEQRTYLHRFIHLDSDFRLKAVTEPFYFKTLGIEFCAGLVQGPAEHQLLLSFGLEDNLAWLVALEIDDVLRQLRPLKSTE